MYSGKYGTDETTRSVYLPLIAIWSPNDRFDIGIEVPPEKKCAIHSAQLRRHS